MDPVPAAEAEVRIRDYDDGDYRDIADLFHRSVHAIAHCHYSSEQLEAWAPSPPDYAFWRKRLAQKRPFVAVAGSRIVGFIELEADGHIDCLYVHQEFQRCGIAGRLYRHLLDVARDRNIAQLYVEASRVAKPFFTSRGFEVRGENRVTLRGQELLNYRMDLILEW